ncbi:MAG: hypothetical protein AB7Q01_16900 [Gammaproteobacteria bacterium]
MHPLKLKQTCEFTQDAANASAARATGDKAGSKPVRYIVPGLYLTPFGDRRNGCLKARC